jgi:hypothetical protein
MCEAILRFPHVVMLVKCIATHSPPPSPDLMNVWHQTIVCIVAAMQQSLDGQLLQASFCAAAQ